LVWRAREGRSLWSSRVPERARLQARASLGGRAHGSAGGKARTDGKSRFRRAVEPVARTPRRGRFRHQDAGQARRRKLINLPISAKSFLQVSFAHWSESNFDELSNASSQFVEIAGFASVEFQSGHKSWRCEVTIGATFQFKSRMTKGDH